jgi:putative transposase
MHKRYHTTFIQMYLAGVLPPDAYKNIPRSTLCSWRKQDYSNLVGSELARFLEEQQQLAIDMYQYKKLKRINEAVHISYLAVTKILDSVRSKKSLFRKNKHIILKAIDQIQPLLDFKKALVYFGISYQQYYGWKNKLKCPDSPVGLCRRKHTRQLTQEEVDAMKNYMTNPDFFHWKIPSIHAKMIRDGTAYFSQTTFYNYAHQLGLMVPHLNSRRKKYKEGIRASRPLEILHMDVTILTLGDHTKAYIYFIQDNFSKAILGWITSRNLSAKIACKNLKEVYHKYLKNSDKVTQLITDGGPEDQGEVCNFTLDEQNTLQQLIAQRDIVFSNSMVEALNYSVKYSFLYTVNLPDFNSLVRFMEK